MVALFSTLSAKRTAEKDAGNSITELKEDVGKVLTQMVGVPKLPIKMYRVAPYAP